MFLLLHLSPWKYFTSESIKIKYWWWKFIWMLQQKCHLKNNSHTPKWYSSIKWIVSCEYMCCESLKESFKKLMVLSVAKLVSDHFTITASLRYLIILEWQNDMCLKCHTLNFSDINVVNCNFWTLFLLIVDEKLNNLWISNPVAFFISDWYSSYQFSISKIMKQNIILPSETINSTYFY